jgi:hypothetical protein
MSHFLVSTTRKNCLFLTPRSGSHSLAIAALRTWYPSVVVEIGHPSQYLPRLMEWPDGPVGLIVRNPIERFRSMIAHRHLDVGEQLENPIYGPLPKGNFVRFFRFEDELDAAAEWLGLPTPLPQEDATDPALKPVLTPEQEARVREIYAADIALWESLQ